jgi:hypothetical protein
MPRRSGARCRTAPSSGIYPVPGGTIGSPLRDRLGVGEPPYGLRHSYASLRIREGASIPELAEELGHSPPMTLGTYAHVIDELRGAPRLPAEREVARAREEVARRGVGRALREALG